MPAIAGLGIFLGIISIIVQIAVVVYFFILFHRIINTVERIEQRTGSIETAIRETSG